MLTAALFTIAKTWKQPKCPPTEEWLEKMWYIHTMEYYSAIKKKETMPSAAIWMDLEIIILSEVCQTVKDKHHVSLICGILKKDTKELICRRETDSQTLKTNLGLPKGTGWGWGGVGDGMCTWRDMEWWANRDLLHSTENSAQYSVII